MGVNEELTPGEHADLRARLLTGAKTIKPVRKHRGAWVSGAVAVALVAAIAGGVGIAATLSAPPPVTGPVTPSPTPSPTAESDPSPLPTLQTPEEPVVRPTVAFGGDCDRVLTADETISLLGPAPTRWDAETHFATSGSASAGLLGGVMCSWHATGDDVGFVGVSVLDGAAVPASVIAEYATVQCGGMSGRCEKGYLVDGIWVGAGLTSNLADPWAEMTDSELARQSDRLDAVLSMVVAKLEPGMAVATPRESDWWTLQPCPGLTDEAITAVGQPLTMGFPGDSIPEGMDWDILVRSGMDDWCSWYNTTENSTIILEVYPQPGVGRPSDAALERPTVTEISVTGADEAWIDVDPQHPETAYVIAVSGPNRLTFRYSFDLGTSGDPEAVAAAILAELG